MPIRILIADDHAMVAEGLRHVVSVEPGFEVIATAGDGAEAARRALELEPDIVLMDLSMPGTDGIEATRVLYDRNPRIRVIAVSMHSRPEYVYRALEAGAQGFVVKRAAGRDLVEAIRAVHGGLHYFSPQVTASVIGRYLSRARREDPLNALSARERQVLQLLAEGKAIAEIAAALNLSPKTVETYRARLYGKLDIHDLASLVRFAIRQGVTSLE